MTDSSEELSWEDIEKMYPGIDPANVLMPSQLRKRITWDVVPCAFASTVMSMVGINQGSDDVEEMEHRESHKRLDAVQELYPAIGMMSSFAAEAVVGAILVSSGAEDLPAEDRAEAISKLAPQIAVSTVGILAELVAAGAVHLPHFAVGVYEVGKSEE